jgi:copper chaperone CopZ
MKCNGCVTTVKDALDKLPGSNNVSVDLESAIAEIDGNVDSGEVENVLTALGYPASKQD